MSSVPRSRPPPLKEQIKELDRLMTRLDGRVQRLKTLSDKTSLPERIARAISSLFHKAKELLAVRTQGEAKSALSAAECDTKVERQKARYGRTYRASIHERMTEMRENIQILETKQRQHQKYTAFVSLIERRVEAIAPMLRMPALPVKSEWKETASLQAIKTKIVIEAIQKRERVPLEYRPTIKLEPLTKNFKALLISSASAVAISNSARPITPIILSADFKRSIELFKSATAAPLKDNAARDIWHKEVTIKIKSLDAIRAARTPIVIQEPMNSPKVWNIEVSNSAKTILERMQADIRERKAVMPKPNRDGFSGIFNYPSKTATDQGAIQKVSAEAKVLRANVPPDMRAEPYGVGNTIASKPAKGFPNDFKVVVQNTPEEKAKKMSSTFNAKAKSEGPPHEPEHDKPSTNP